MTGAIQQILRRCITGVQIEYHLLRLQLNGIYPHSG
jgi:hypothetical protein